MLADVGIYVLASANPSQIMQKTILKDPHGRSLPRRREIDFETPTR
jgi:hypothetical protein